MIGAGSEVLGFDTVRSTDHDWGPRLQLFLGPDDVAAHGTEIAELLADGLAGTVAGYPTTLGPGSVVAALGSWFAGCLGFDPRAEITVPDWCSVASRRDAALSTR